MTARPQPRLALAPPDGRDLDRKFEELYHQHFDDVYAYMLRRQPTAEVPDLVAEVFATAWRRIEDIPPSPEARLWLYRVARLSISQHVRGERRRQRLHMKLGRQPDLLLRTLGTENDIPLSVVGALERLRAVDREVVRLIGWEGLAHAEVGFILGCSPNAVAIRWHRALKRIKTLLDSEGTDSSAKAAESVKRRSSEGES